MVLTSTQIGSFRFENCLMNAAGVRCMTINDLEAIRHSKAGAFVTKTATLEARAGNPSPRMASTPLGTINSMGLPNKGFQYYLDYLLSLQEKEPQQSHFFSVVGMSQVETHVILQTIQNSNYQGLVELNLSCPNVPGKPQIAYDFETTE